MAERNLLTQAGEFNRCVLGREGYITYNPENYFRNPANLYPNIVSVNMLGVPRERTQNVTGLSEIADPTEHPFKGADLNAPRTQEG